MDPLPILQRFVDNHAQDIGTVQAAIADDTTPAPAKRLLVGALNYTLDVLDMFPDHYKGLGVADDAVVLRLAAQAAVGAGASNGPLKALADEAADVAALFPDLVGQLTTFVGKLPGREVRGRDADKIVTQKDARVTFDADVTRTAQKYQPHPIESPGGPVQALKELEKMARAALKRAGIV